MNQRLVTSASDVTADRLTTILRGAGHLRAGGVAEVAAQPHGDARTIEERTSAARLAVRYTPDARPALSRRLFLKCCRASIHGETSPRLMAMERREVMVMSRASSTTTTQAGTRPRWTIMTSAAMTISLSASGSRNFPTRLTSFRRRAR